MNWAVFAQTIENGEVHIVSGCILVKRKSDLVVGKKLVCFGKMESTLFHFYSDLSASQPAEHAPVQSR